jgi:predicted site-specific integrase-resolvase
MSRMTTLEAWAAAKFGEHAPRVDTLRRWARDGKIYPVPRKHGRSYYVSEQAQYVNGHSDIARAIRESAATQ